MFEHTAGALVFFQCLANFKNQLKNIQCMCVGTECLCAPHIYRTLQGSPGGGVIGSC